MSCSVRGSSAAFPAARIFYALKANPGRPILQRLAALGEKKN